MKLRTEQKAAVGILLCGALAAALLCSGNFAVNISSSVPPGLWRRTGGPVEPGGVVEVPFEAFRSTDWVPEAYRKKNDFGRIVPYLKRVAGKTVPGSAPLSADRAGNVMRAFPLPIRLASDEVWLLSDSPRGFDSRYLGPAKLDMCTRVVPLIVF